ncbi:MAG TPA: hypothetical protein VEC96_08560, partial [Anaerolineae bacterium]|nr:hypothetical protein [Anaerolineae bacterium]
YPFNFLVYEKNPLLESNVASYPAFTLLAYGSNIARYFFPAYFSDKFADFDQLRWEAQWGSDEWKSEVAQIYVNNLIKADKISHTFGADFIAFAQPLLYFKDQPAPEEEDLFGNWERKEYCLQVRQKIREEIEKSTVNASFKIVDLSDIYDNTSERIFTDAIHTTQASKPVVVQAMYQHIMQDFGAKFAEVQYRQ